MSNLAFERDARGPRPASTAGVRVALIALLVVVLGAAVLLPASPSPARDGVVRTGFDEPANGRPGRRY
jgi:hypothetical protein